MNRIERLLNQHLPDFMEAIQICIEHDVETVGLRRSDFGNTDEDLRLLGAAMKYAAARGIGVRWEAARQEAVFVM